MVIELFVPGRLCLFGEHSDWAGGWRRTHPGLAPGHCLVAGTDQGLRARVAPVPDAVEIASRLPDGRRIGPERLPLDERVLAAIAEAGGFFSYVAGTVAEVRARWPGIGGVRIDIVDNDLPLAKGLSSSAAICVLVARAFARVYGLPIDVADEMRIAYAGERRAGSACGLMDQVCAHGRVVTALRFDGDAFDVASVAVGGPVALLVVDLRRQKDTRRILSDLNACFPATDGALAARVRTALGPVNAGIVGRARAALERGDAPALGALMTEAQARFDADVAPACPELAAPRLHEVLAHPAVRDYAWGGKGVGSQGDGCAQLVARDESARRALAVLLERELSVATLPLTLGT